MSGEAAASHSPREPRLRVAVDGPAGAGKSTVCRELARRIGASYLDTGAMYRVATLHVLRSGIDVTAEDATERIGAATAGLPLTMSSDADDDGVWLGGEDVRRDIRTAEVTAAVSAVSAVPAVREELVRVQRRVASEVGRSVLDGRDIGTVVLPDAEVKVFLTASAEVRAQRRVEQDREAGRSADYDEVLASVRRRDELDSTRAVSPLIQAADAVVIDSSKDTVEEVLRSLEALVAKADERWATHADPQDSQPVRQEGPAQ